MEIRKKIRRGLYEFKSRELNPCPEYKVKGNTVYRIKRIEQVARYMEREM